MSNTKPTTLHLTLLGTLQVQLGDSPLSLRRTKEQALLIYLAVTGQPQSRAVLVDLLWSEMPETKARRNLTATLTNLRKVLGSFLQIDATSVALYQDAAVTVDLCACQRLLAEGKVEDDSTKLRQAIALYRGDFLTGFTVKDAFVFEEWVYAERERIREEVLDGLERLVAVAIRQEKWNAAVEDANRLLLIEPWRESAHRQLMLLHAQAGRRDAVVEQFRHCKEILAEELAVEPDPATIALFERLQRGGNAPPHNLPAAPNAFVGRNDERHAISETLLNPDCRLLTILGPGGMGKTRLAIEAARPLLETSRYIGVTTEMVTFDDGIFFVPLAGVHTDPDHANTVVATIADSIGLPFGGTAEPRSQLLNYLKERRLLLIWDNVEHLISDTRQEPVLELITTILRQTSGVKLLITSRQRLHLQEAWTIEIVGLTYPAPADDMDLLTATPRQGGWPDLLATTDEQSNRVTTQQTEYSAVTLFIQRAQQMSIGFTPSAGERPYIVRICQLVAGMPLALELAASWLRTLSCAEIVAEIEQSLDFLTTTLYNVPTRHRSLRAIFEHSWQMLALEEQQIFCRLAVFRGGFSQEAARVVAQATLPILTSLIDKSFVQRVAARRLVLHEMMRQFAMEKLTDCETEVPAIFPSGNSSSLTTTIWQTHCQYYLGAVSQQTKLLPGHPPKLTVAELWPDLDNIRQAWQCAFQAGWIDLLEPAIGGLARIYDHRALFQEGEQIFGEAVATLQNQLSVAQVDTDATLDRVLVKLQIHEARFLARQGLSNRALDLIIAAVKLAESQQDPKLMAVAMQLHGEILQSLGQYQMAQQQLKDVLVLAQQVQMPAVISHAQLNLAIVAQSQGHYGTAQRWLEQAQQGFLALGDQRNLNIVLLNLGALAVSTGDHPRGRQLFEQGLIQARAMADVWSEAMLLNNLGVMAYEEGRYSQAQSACQQGLQLARRLMDYTNEANLLHSLGNIHRDQGDYANAQCYYQQCLTQCHKHNDPDTKMYALVDLGLLLHNHGEQENARDYCQQAIALATELQIPTIQAQAETFLGHVLFTGGLTAAAADAYRHSITLASELEPYQTIEARTGLAAALSARGEPLSALAEVEAVLDFLAMHPLTGIIEPFRVYLTCYQILQHQQDPRAAEIVAIAYQRLHERAAAILDKELQRSFLEEIPAHRVLVRAVRENNIVVD